MADELSLNLRELYDHFNQPVTKFDCGLICALHNPTGKPFCCDICQTVPVAYHQEWDYLQRHTDLWHVWRGDECQQDPVDPADLTAQTPEHLLLLACQGPTFCQRNFRSISCRQFPFFPYITSTDQFIGLAYEWDFEPVCWVISHLETVSKTYCDEFVQFFDGLLALWPAEFDNFAAISEEMREHFAAQRRRIPILHRDGNLCLLSPASERLWRVSPDQLERFGPYREKGQRTQGSSENIGSLSYQR